MQDVSEPAQVVPETGEKTEIVIEERKNNQQLDTTAVKDQSSVLEPKKVEGKKEDKSKNQHFQNCMTRSKDETSHQYIFSYFKDQKPSLEKDNILFKALFLCLQRMWRFCCYRLDSIRRNKLFKN